jgi:hypothetical protein
VKVILHLPAHPSYFDGEYTQEEIDKALADYDALASRMISKGRLGPVSYEFMLHREPGKPVGVAEIDSAGFYAQVKQYYEQDVPEAYKQKAIEGLRRQAAEECQTMIGNIKEFLKVNRCA